MRPGGKPMFDRRSTIAIVEDNRAFRDLVALRLRPLGYDIVCAASVAEAISLLESRHVDAVLSDHSLGGATGLELLAYVQRRLPGLPFVLMSGAVTDGLEAAADAGGATAVVPKDELLVQLHRLFAAVPRCLQRRRDGLSELSSGSQLIPRKLRFPTCDERAGITRPR